MRNILIPSLSFRFSVFYKIEKFVVALIPITVTYSSIGHNCKKLLKSTSITLWYIFRSRIR